MAAADGSAAGNGGQNRVSPGRPSAPTLAPPASAAAAAAAAAGGGWTRGHAKHLSVPSVGYDAYDPAEDYALGVSRDDWDREVAGRVALPTGLEKSLTAQILHTYETRLFPSAESIEVKRAFIEKFATILVTEFPEWEVDIHVFGSSVNGLGTSRSDVDICLTTEHRELEDVFVLNKALRKHQMRTYCIPRARVPIVKIWDPELRIASDINVNNTIALHNTRMLQTFVAIDGRVRPFVMAVKHWTKCREINDAAFGGTLSSYAWVNLAIHFLQTRQPAILPVLHPPAPSLDADECRAAGEVDLSFNDDIAELREFGRANTESLGFLLYAFFRTYSYEFDYRHQVVSLRSGCYLTKAQKGWDSGRPARIFCIEEPFSTWLNLGHSANTVSVEGIRREFQRAFAILREGGSFDQVCEIYQRPPQADPTPAPLQPVHALPDVATAVPDHASAIGYPVACQPPPPPPQQQQQQKYHHQQNRHAPHHLRRTQSTQIHNSHHRSGSASSRAYQRSPTGTIDGRVRQRHSLYPAYDAPSTPGTYYSQPSACPSAEITAVEAEFAASGFGAGAPQLPYEVYHGSPYGQQPPAKQYSQAHRRGSVYAHAEHVDASARDIEEQIRLSCQLSRLAVAGRPANGGNGGGC
ncbi:hypothetical protein H4R21_002564 [Coemansia helicoidea]|uniref:Uncharacterized protein n=1 Tax=Coemansia helicoidea TaxID=1286919 RepID=A0ACC1L7L7_9FUNG|nr:hypothetical protein H4R21_002564 [Coemansia helicoidea]